MQTPMFDYSGIEIIGKKGKGLYWDGVLMGLFLGKVIVGEMVSS